MSLSPAEELAHSTVRIECELDGGGIGTGTGFFYSLNRTENNNVPVIVTNNHVIEGAIKGRFFLTLKNPDGSPAVGNYQSLEIENFKELWRSHPDSNVDLCVMPIAPIIKKVESQGMPYYFRTLNKSFIPSTKDIEELIGLEKITMVGYPNGLWDETNNMPIFRQGISATNYKHDWNGEKKFLIDAACFPGSSGSPVMLFDLGGYHSMRGNIIGSHRIKLLGVLYAVHQHTAEGNIEVVTVPTIQRTITVTGIPNNLGVIIKSEQLLAFEGLSY